MLFDQTLTTTELYHKPFYSKLFIWKTHGTPFLADSVYACKYLHIIFLTWNLDLHVEWRHEVHEDVVAVLHGECPQTFGVGRIQLWPVGRANQGALRVEVTAAYWNPRNSSYNAEIPVTMLKFQLQCWSFSYNAEILATMLKFQLQYMYRKNSCYNHLI